MKLKTIFFFLILSTSSLISQEIKPLFQTPYLDNQIHFEELENGSFISLENVMVFDTILQANDNYAFTTLKKYNAQGVEIRNYSFNYNDSSKYKGTFLNVLDDGRYLVGGRKENTNTITSKHFLKIISEDLFVEELDIVFTVPNNLFIVNAYKENDTLNCIFSSDTENYKYIVRYDLQGNYIDMLSMYYNFQTPVIGGSNYFSSFQFNNSIFLPFMQSNILTAPPTSFIVKIKDNQIIDTISLQDSFQLNTNLVHFDKTGCLINESEYLISSRVKNPFSNSSYLSIFKFSKNDSPSLFYLDSSVFVNITNEYPNMKIASKSTNNIYVVIEDTSYIRNMFVYNLNKDGSLKWRKSINTEIGNYQYAVSYELSTTCATKDGGIIFTFQADDDFNNHGVYYCKLDSNGNKVDFPTGIFSLSPKIEINDFALFPNPIQEKLNIESELRGNFKLNVYNVLGKKVKSYNFENNVSLDLENLNHGNYFYTITNETNVQLQEGKFLKE